jgi:hypothetical protein
MLHMLGEVRWLGWHLVGDIAIKTELPELPCSELSCLIRIQHACHPVHTQVRSRVCSVPHVFIAFTGSECNTTSSLCGL